MATSSACLITTRVAALCDDCGIEVGIGLQVPPCHLVEERGRFGFFCPECCRCNASPDRSPLQPRKLRDERGGLG